ncbi:unnamed protein product [Caenorhabditis angaria]|uniref:Uncharacterized protein n=1 Tax=Caenorhabditis angaria TaxID=860376 RepID=A0A9P1IDW9_9PELO|nr:unnamed protein product [Caenorhabditis angaria]
MKFYLAQQIECQNFWISYHKHVVLKNSNILHQDYQFIKNGQITENYDQASSWLLNPGDAKIRESFFGIP